MFALQGKRRQQAFRQDGEVGWSTSWGGISSQGRLLKTARGTPRVPNRKK